MSWSRPTRSYIANQGRAGPGRRMPWEPGRSATRPVPRLAVLVDVSGSVDAALLSRFTQEIEAIARRLEAALVLIVGDDRVRLVRCFDPGEVDLGAIPFEGGEGTDFTPLLQEAQRHRPDAAVVLTDLEGPARFQPPCPVLWAVPAACHAARPPFGRLLVLD
jgi:predicted metal-dependent peptidase